jgi:hypothetical protein
LGLTITNKVIFLQKINMADGTSFKVYDPVAQLIACTHGSGLPLTGGALSGDLTLTAPAKVIQCQAPVGPCDLTNKTYVDGLIGGGPFLPLSGGAMTGAITQPLAPLTPNDLTNKAYTDGAYQAKQPLAVTDNIAVFGSGSDVGQTTDSGFSIDINLSNPPSNSTLWPSNRLIGALQYGADVYKATSSINIPALGSIRAFSTGNATVGLVTWPNFGSTFNLGGTGIATITNALEFTTYFKISFSANSLSESTNAYGSVQCQFQNDNGPPVPFGVIKTLKVFPVPPSDFCNEVYLSATTSVAPGDSFDFSVLLTNPGISSITIDPNSPDDPCLLIIERVG